MVTRWLIAIVCMIAGGVTPAAMASAAVAPAGVLHVVMAHERWAELPTGYVIVAEDEMAGKVVGSTAVNCRADPVSHCFADFNLPGGSFYASIRLRSGGGASGVIVAGTGHYTHAAGTVSGTDTSNTITSVTATFSTV